MARLPIISAEDMNENQRNIHDRILSGKRAGFRGPFNIWVHSPGFWTFSKRWGPTFASTAPWIRA